MKPSQFTLRFRWPAWFWLALLPCALLAGTNPAWVRRSWQTEDGLPEFTIIGLEQTPDGYLRLATHEGLFRFDGIRFQEFVPAMQASLPGGQIRCLVQDGRGWLWLARDGGLVMALHAGTVTWTRDLNSDGFRGQPRSMARDSDGALWLSDARGSVFRLRDTVLEVFGPAQGLDHSPCRLAADGRGQIWFSQSGGIGPVRQGQFLRLPVPGLRPTAIAGARGQGVWSWSGGRLWRCGEDLSPTPVAELPVGLGPAAFEVSVLYEDRSGGVWIGANSGGLLRFDGRTIAPIDFALPAITAITEDLEGDIWVGSRGGGLDRFRLRAAEVIGVDQGLPFVAVESACQDAAGMLWVAAQDGSLARREGGGWRLLTASEGWLGGSAISLAPAPAGGVYLGTRDRGVFLERNGAFSALPLNAQMTNHFIRSLLVASNADLWIGPNAGDTLYRAREGRLTPFALPPGSGNVRTLAEGWHSDLWAGTSNALLLHLVGDQVIDATIRFPDRASKGIRCLHTTSDGSLWIGYAGGGLGWLRDGAAYAHFGSAEGLWDDYVCQIVADPGYLWLAGNRGIWQVDRLELAAVAAGKTARVRSVVLGRGEGLPNLQASFGVWPLSARCADGRILMPMQTGLAAIQPGRLLPTTHPPPVVIELLRANGRAVAGYESVGNEPGEADAPACLQARSRSLTVRPGVDQMEFEFTALSLASPENVSFRYRLEGADQAWVEAGGARVARYPHLPPGPYRFRVMACGHDGVWNEAGDAVAFAVRPFLWERTWFRAALVLGCFAAFAGGLLFAARRRYARRIARLEHHQALERERTRIARDLHDDLGAGLVEINLSSELARDPTAGAEEMREHTREIGLRAREMVTALDEIVWAINPRHDTVSSLATYFCQYAQHFLKTSPVRCHLDVARDLPAAPLNAEQRHTVFLAFKEALANVARHARATELRLAISAPAHRLVVAIHDNGRGFEPRLPAGPGADGLENMRRRLRMVGGECQIQSSPGQGTVVTFLIPLPPPA